MATVTPMIEPDQDAMRAHLEHLFGGDLGGAHDGRIEIAWTDAVDGKLRHGAIFGTDQIEEAIEHAVIVNRVPQQNVYVGAALRNPGVAPFGRGADIDFYALTALYVDIDDDVLAQARDHYRHRGCPPTAVVVTGRQPHVRAQLLWRLDEPERDPQATRAQLKALADALGGDVTVVNPSRVLRLAGSIAWPVKPGRVLEHTEWQMPQDGRPKAYLWGQIARAFPPPAPIRLRSGSDNENSLGGVTGHASDVTSLGADHAISTGYAAQSVTRHAHDVATRSGENSSGGLNLDLGVRVDDYMAAIRAGRQWHNHLLGLIAHWVSRGWSDAEILATAPSWTLAGYTVAQTVADMRKMIEGARAKWNIPDPEPVVSETGETTAGPDAEVFSIADLKGDPKPREWLVEGWLPKRAVTILYGDGGTGKTLIAQQLGTCMRIGRPWLGLPVAQGNVFAVFCEDSRDEIHWRQHHINGHYGIALTSALTGFDAVSRFGHNNQIAVWDMKGNVQVTPFYAWLLEQVKERRPELLILDTAADMFAGNENSRVEVNHFLKAVVGRFVAEFGVTVLILAHPSLTGLTTGSGMGGSTAWNNAVRSRWSLVKPKDEDGDIRTLTKMKANYASAGDDEKIELVWDDGVIDVPASAGALAKLEQKALKRKILIAIDEAWKAGKGIGGNQSNRPARTVLPGMVRDRPGKVMKALGGLVTEGFVTQERQQNKRAYKVDSWPAWFGKADENDDD